MREAVYIAVGAASMCWNPIPEGVFDTERAQKVSEDLINRLSRDGSFHDELTMLLRRRHCSRIDHNVLAKFLLSCLEAYEIASEQQLENWSHDVDTVAPSVHPTCPVSGGTIPTLAR